MVWSKKRACLAKFQMSMLAGKLKVMARKLLGTLSNKPFLASQIQVVEVFDSCFKLVLKDAHN